MLLSRRERQIMDILHARQGVTAAEIREAMSDAPGYSAVRALLRILEGKGHVKHREDGPRYIYFPRASRETAGRLAVTRLVTTFFQGSVTDAVAALLDSHDAKLSDAELERLREVIKQAEQEGR